MEVDWLDRALHAIQKSHHYKHKQSHETYFAGEVN